MISFRLKSAEEQIVSVALKGAQYFGGRVDQEEGTCDSFRSTPPVLLHGSHAFSMSMEVPRTYVVHVILEHELE